jgi:RNA polymerase sigma-70 factor, ECF subfamily
VIEAVGDSAMGGLNMMPQSTGALDSRPGTAVQARHGAVGGTQGRDRDAGLVDLLRFGAPGATEQLIATYGERAYRLAIRVTGNAPDAEEVVQDALWAVVQKIDSFRGDAAFGSWFYRVVANAAYQKIRGRQRRGRELALGEVLPLFDEKGRHMAPMADWSPHVDNPEIRAELRMALTAAIDELPAAYRTVLVLRDVEGRSSREVANTLGLSIPLVKTRLHRARLFLRKRLGYSMTTMH